MKVNLLGIRRNVRIENNNTGEIIQGTSLYIGYRDPNVDGLMTDKVFVNSRLPIACLPDLRPEQIIDLDLNTKGKIIDITIVQ